MLKTFIAFTILASTTLHATPDLANKMVGTYAAVGVDCAYETATIKTKRTDGKTVLFATLKNETLRTFSLHSVDLDNLWTKVKTTRGFTRIIKQDRIMGGALVSEEKSCKLGWIGCDEWTIEAELTMTDSNTLVASLNGEAACSYSRITE